MKRSILLFSIVQESINAQLRVQELQNIFLHFCLKLMAWDVEDFDMIRENDVTLRRDDNCPHSKRVLLSG